MFLYKIFVRAFNTPSTLGPPGWWPYRASQKFIPLKKSHTGGMFGNCGEDTWSFKFTLKIALDSYRNEVMDITALCPSSFWKYWQTLSPAANNIWYLRKFCCLLKIISLRVSDLPKDLFICRIYKKKKKKKISNGECSFKVLKIWCKSFNFLMNTFNYFFGDVRGGTSI